MAFLAQLSGQLSTVKEQLGQMPALAQLKEGAVPLVEQAKRAHQGLFSKAGVAGGRASPIDLVPVLTAYGAHLADANFTVDYASTGDFRLVNGGTWLSLERAGDEPEFDATFLDGGTGGEQQQQQQQQQQAPRYHLDRVIWHWGSEPMNGSEHTVGGVGYAGELQLVHRRIDCPNMETALRTPQGCLALAVFLNESHEENGTLDALLAAVRETLYRGRECRLSSFPFAQLVPAREKQREFWLYEGAETWAACREHVTWVVMRAPLPIASRQLKLLREVRAVGDDEEVEQPMRNVRPVQPLNGRPIVASFKAAAKAPDLGFSAISSSN